jgi:hypothetical protein
MTTSHPAEPDQRVTDDLRDIARDRRHLADDVRDLERDEERLEHDLRHPQPRHDHHVQMNTKPLVLHGDRLTGAEIKQQAIDSGFTNIEPDFTLTVERNGHGPEETIGDDDPWTVHDGDCFTAVAADDNS